MGNTQTTPCKLRNAALAAATQAQINSALVGSLGAGTESFALARGARATSQLLAGLTLSSPHPALWHPHPSSSHPLPSTGELGISTFKHKPVFRDELLEADEGTGAQL